MFGETRLASSGSYIEALLETMSLCCASIADETGNVANYYNVMVRKTKAAYVVFMIHKQFPTLKVFRVVYDRRAQKTESL